MSGIPIGCTRFVHGQFDGNAAQNLPMEEYANKSLNHGLMQSIRESGKSYAEVSRLSILAEFRGNKGHNHKPLGLFAANSALLKLVLGIKAYAD